MDHCQPRKIIPERGNLFRQIVTRPKAFENNDTNVRGYPITQYYHDFYKRKAHLASLVVSNQMTRQEAIEELKLPLYDSIELEQDRIYWCKKLDIDMDDFYKVMEEKPKFYSDYPNNSNTMLLKCLKFAAKFYRLVVEK